MIENDLSMSVYIDFGDFFWHEMGKNIKLCHKIVNSNSFSAKVSVLNYPCFKT